MNKNTIYDMRYYEVIPWELIQFLTKNNYKERGERLNLVQSNEKEEVEIIKSLFNVNNKEEKNSIFNSSDIMVCDDSSKVIAQG